MMTFLQWAGSLLIIAGYWYMLQYPRTSSWCTLLGCVLSGAWAAMLEPAGLGVLVLEVFVAVMATRNLRKLHGSIR